jgi:hypothetical protein
MLHVKLTLLSTEKLDNLAEQTIVLSDRVFKPGKQHLEIIRIFVEIIH